MPLAPRSAALVLGACVGDALAAPVDGLSHQHVRFYYRGIKGPVDDEHRGVPAGTGTARTARLLARLGAPTPASATPANGPGGTGDLDGHDGVDATDAALVDAIVAVATDAGGQGPETGDGTAGPEGVGAVHARALRHVLSREVASTGPAPGGPAPGSPAPGGPVFGGEAFDAAAFVAEVEAAAPEALRPGLARVLARRAGMPLDVHDAATAAFPGDAALAAWAFGIAMVARAPHLVEATLLSAINAGDSAATTGLVVGSLLGALHGPGAFPAAWTDALAAAGPLARLAA